MNTSPEAVGRSGPGRPRATTLRDALRDRTRDAHSALECSPLMAAFADGIADRNYAYAYLARQFRLHRDLEHALACVLPPDIAAQRLCRTGWLTEDLRRLELPLDPRPAATPVLTTLAEGIGTLYVIEGSTLGLQSVRRRIAAAGESGWVLESRFVRGYGDATAARWRDFLLHLESLPAAQWPGACDAAVRTFDAFIRLFQDATHD